MADYLLEVRTEEIPARFMPQALKELKVKAEEVLNAEGIAYQSLNTTGTARRLVLTIEGIAEETKSLKIESKGPSVQAAYDDKGQPTRALLGFMKGQGASVEELQKRIIKNTEYVYFEKEVPGVLTSSILGSLIEKILKNMHFPKMMFWGEGLQSFVRPVRSILSLYNNEILSFNFAGVESSNWTVGHRFLSQGSIIIENQKDYFKQLEKAFVIVDDQCRLELIKKGIKEQEDSFSAKVPSMPKLLEEILYLVEYPTVFVGAFDEKYLRLPKEVITLSMAKHQKYFPLENEQGVLLPKFISVRCGSEKYIEEVIKGNEKVLVARLEDAKFFYEEDQKTPLIKLKQRLDRVVFQEQLGTIGDKIKRIETLSTYMGITLFQDDLTKIQETALLAKCDLETQMVYEFPELQGKMGAEYSRIEGAHPMVSKGILEHYKPVFSGDTVATTPTGIVVGIADKIDTIVGMMGIGRMPTGSQDPYGLRRHGLGIIRTLIENKIHLSLKEIIRESASIYSDALNAFDENQILDFFKVRMKSILEQELSYDMVESLLKEQLDDCYDLYLKALDMKKFSTQEGFENLVEVLKRANNIIKKQKDIPETFKMELLTEPVEQTLGESVEALRDDFSGCMLERNYEKALIHLSELKEPLHNFFESVMVMDENMEIRNNRLGLLAVILKMGNSLFDIESIVI